ncbi:uncharacterized protein L201_007235 [Kwoniella dendrophila CBS 6074]|uniref:Uncharacterized protein n=1 Tax=Kwoniella dendrophila CBS 6074 TaxID=1295534 RepID=A0AAX4K3G1_9TREE
MSALQILGQVNQDEEYEIFPVLVHPNKTPEQTALRLQPKYRSGSKEWSDDEDGYMDIVNPDLPVLNVSNPEMSTGGGDTDIRINRSMLFGRDGTITALPTEAFLEDVQSTVGSYRASISKHAHDLRKIEHAWTDYISQQEAQSKLPSSTKKEKECKGLREEILDGVLTDLEARTRKWRRDKSALEMYHRLYIPIAEEAFETLKDNEEDLVVILLNDVVAKAAISEEDDEKFLDRWADVESDKISLRHNIAAQTMSECSFNMLKESLSGFDDEKLNEIALKSIARTAEKDANEKRLHKLEGEFLNAFHERYGKDTKVPTTGKKWNRLASKHSVKDSSPRSEELNMRSDLTFTCTDEEADEDSSTPGDHEGFFHRYISTRTGPYNRKFNSSGGPTFETTGPDGNPLTLSGQFPSEPDLGFRMRTYCVPHPSGENHYITFRNNGSGEDDEQSC